MGLDIWMLDEMSIRRPPPAGDIKERLSGSGLGVHPQPTAPHGQTNTCRLKRSSSSPLSLLVLIGPPVLRVLCGRVMRPTL